MLMVENFTTVDENTSREKADSELEIHLVELMKNKMLTMEESPSQQVIDKLLAYSASFKK